LTDGFIVLQTTIRLRRCNVTKQIKDTGKLARTISSKDKLARSIDPAKVTKALGAKEVKTNGEIDGSSPALFGLRQALYERLRSTGGRPSLEGAGERQKIPLIEGDWERLQEVADLSQSEDFRPTPAQVASILLHRALDQIVERKTSDAASQSRRR
jgi:hypothetical protein